MLLIRPALYLIMFFFIMQLDAYFYLLGVTVIAPFVQVFFATIFVVCVYILYMGRHITMRLSRESIVLWLCLLLYINVKLFGIITWYVMPNDTVILFFWVYMIVLLLMGAMTGALIGERIPYVLFSILVILVAVTVVDTLFGGISVSQTWGRSASTLRNPNASAFVMVILMLGSMRWQRLGMIEIFAFIIAGAGIIFTQSRGGLLAYATFTIIFSIWWSRLGQTSGVRAKRYLVAGLFGIAAVSIVTLVLSAARFGSDGMDNALHTTVSDPTQRILAMQIALELINEKPLFGYGTGFVYTQLLGPHNMLLRAWVENGVPGVLGILVLPLGLFWVGLVRRDQSLIALTIVLSVHAMTTHNLTEARSILIITGLLLANSARKKAVNRPLVIASHDKRGAAIS
jgi:O-antigen ligase